MTALRAGVRIAGMLLACGCAGAPRPSAGEPFVIEERHAPAYMLSGGHSLATLLIHRENCGAEAASLGTLSMDPGGAVPEHVHPESAELIYTTSGRGILVVEGKETLLEPNTAIYIPAGARHSFRVVGDEVWRGVQVYAPGGPEARFRSGSIVPR